MRLCARPEAHPWSGPEDSARPCSRAAMSRLPWTIMHLQCWQRTAQYQSTGLMARKYEPLSATDDPWERTVVTANPLLLHGIGIQDPGFVFVSSPPCASIPLRPSCPATVTSRRTLRHSHGSAPVYMLPWAKKGTRPSATWTLEDSRSERARPRAGCQPAKRNVVC